MEAALAAGVDASPTVDGALHLSDAVGMTKSSRHLAPIVGLCSIVLFFAGCGGGGGSDAFCHDYAAAFCKKMIQCEPGGGTPSESECTAGFAKLCTDAPPAGTTMAVNCSGGKSVDSNAKSACLSQLSSATCDQFSADSYLDTCAQVCTTAPATGAGGSKGSGGAGGSGSGGSGGSSGSPTTPVAFCEQLWQFQCDFSYQCTTATEQSDPIFIALFGASLSECKGSVMTDRACATASCPGGTYSASLAKTCLSKSAALSCSAELPTECKSACPQS